jgi:hypothetical protein
MWDEPREYKFKASQESHYNTTIELDTGTTNTRQTPKYFIPHVLEYWNFINGYYKVKKTKPRFLDIGTGSGYLMQAYSSHCTSVVGYERFYPWFEIANEINYDCPKDLYHLDWLLVSDTPHHEEIINKSDIIFCMAGKLVLNKITSILSKMKITKPKLLIAGSFSPEEFDNMFSLINCKNDNSLFLCKEKSEKEMKCYLDHPQDVKYSGYLTKYDANIKNLNYKTFYHKFAHNGLKNTMLSLANEVELDWYEGERMFSVCASYYRKQNK